MNQVLKLALALIAIAAASNAHSDPIKVPALYNKIYAPQGFDSNDNVQIVGEGMFKNTCYRHAETTVKVDESAQKIFVGPVAYEYSGLCLQLILPFERVIDVGILKPGLWQVIQSSTQEKLGEVSIRAATKESADDYLYAPISQAFLEQSGGQTSVTLTGTFTNDCLSLNRVDVTVENDVIVLQPIADMAQRTNCKDGEFPFSVKTSIGTVKTGRYLLHVRSMNGNAVNTLVDVK